MADLEQLLREMVLTSGRTINSIAVSAGVPQPSLWYFAKGRRAGRGRRRHYPDVKLSTVSKLFAELGLEVRPKRKRKTAV
jgi:hypothetical protein